MPAEGLAGLGEVALPFLDEPEYASGEGLADGLAGGLDDVAALAKEPAAA
ncbi:hypothetical protein AB0D45_20505 [Streptomyces sp. NPDC048352]